MAVAPPPYIEGKEDDATLFNVSAALWFRESLGAAPGVELIPEPRSSALFHEISGGAWVMAASPDDPSKLCVLGDSIDRVALYAPTMRFEFGDPFESPCEG